ncbi:MAG: DUF2946 family protein [Acetobacteraceae bacterium]
MRHAACTLIRVMVLLALVLRTGVAPFSVAGTAALGLEGVAICHAEGSSSPVPLETPPASHDCALCPVCLIHASQAVPVVSGPSFPPPLSVPPADRFVLAPPATGPPSARTVSARPRGPPA